MPAAAEGSRKPKVAQGLERAGIVVGAGEDQVAARAGEARRFLEQPRIVAFHAMQAVEQVLLEGRSKSA